VVARDEDGGDAGAVQFPQEVVEQPLRLRRRRRGVIDISRDDDAVDGLLAGVVENLLKGGLVLRVSRAAADRAPQVPV